MATVGVKLEEKTRSRLNRLGKAKNRSTHWLMKDAIERYLDQEERFEREKAEDRIRWQRYLDTGDHITHERMATWLDELAEGATAETDTE